MNHATTKRVGLVLALTAVQSAVFVAIYEVVFAAARYLGEPFRPDLAYGILVHYSLYLLSALAFVNSLAQATLRRSSTKLSVFALVVIAFGGFVRPAFSIHPYRSGLLLVSAMMAFGLPVLIGMGMKVSAAAEHVPGPDGAHEGPPGVR